MRPLIKLCATCIIFTSLAFINVSNAQFYIRGNIGAPVYHKTTGSLQNNIPLRVAGNMVIGTSVNRYLSLELEGGYLSFPVNITTSIIGTDQTSISSLTALLNLITYLPLSSDKFKPFLGVGIGYTNNKTGISASPQNTTTSTQGTIGQFAYQIFLGGECMINKNFSVVGDARWVDLNKFLRTEPSGAMEEFTLKNIMLTIGAKFNL